MTEYKISNDKTMIIGIIENNYPSLKELILSKGFDISYDKLGEEIALLHSEVSELSNAIKKGLGKEEEAYEIADIVIRLLHIPYLVPEVIPTLYNRNITNDLNISYNAINDIQCKYMNSSNLHSAISKLGEDISEYQFWNDKKSKDDFKESPFIDMNIKSCLFRIACYMISVVSMCEFYNAKFLNNNLQDLIDKKMKKNWERPYRYNTCEEHFQ